METFLVLSHHFIPLLGIACLWLHYVTCWSDPGFIPLDVAAPTFHFGEPTEETLRQHLPFKPRLEQAYSAKCKKCAGLPWKPPRAHHCKTCRRCVFKVVFPHQMDHHCIWMANCIGAGNLKPFYQFTLLASYYSLGINIVTGLWLVNKHLYEFTGAFGWKNPTWVHIFTCWIVFFLTLGGFIMAVYFRDEVLDGVRKNQSVIEWGKGDFFGVKVDSY